MATNSSILAWRIPWMEEPCGLQSMVHKELDTTEWLTLSLYFLVAWSNHSNRIMNSIGKEFRWNPGEGFPCPMMSAALVRISRAWGWLTNYGLEPSEVSFAHIWYLDWTDSRTKTDDWSNYIRPLLATRDHAGPRVVGFHSQGPQETSYLAVSVLHTRIRQIYILSLKWLESSIPSPSTKPDKSPGSCPISLRFFAETYLLVTVSV